MICAALWKVKFLLAWALLTGGCWERSCVLGASSIHGQRRQEHPGEGCDPGSFRLCQDNSSEAAAHSSQSPWASPENKDRNDSLGVGDRNGSMDVGDRNDSMDAEDRNDSMDVEDRNYSMEVKPACLESGSIPGCVFVSRSSGVFKCRGMAKARSWCKNLEWLIFTPTYFHLNVWQNKGRKGNFNWVFNWKKYQQRNLPG